VAKEVIESAFEGYNGTIFAYGQTGSGKTFTITGGAERYQDRGLIPRSISHIFNTFKENSGTHKYKLNISYLEIYNNNGYDLLSEDHATKNLEDLPKVKMYDTSNDQFILKNLSVHRAETEEDALNLLFIGDTNRAVAETPMNDASTRSHCIFIMQIES
jgi:kinesin family protein 6/9